MPNGLGYTPIQSKFRKKMNEVAASLDRLFNGNAKGSDRKVGFVLLVFPFGTAGKCNYISNGADRKEIVIMMKEQIKRFEGQPETSGNT